MREAGTQFRVSRRDRTGSLNYPFEKIMRSKMKKQFVLALALSAAMVGAPMLAHVMPNAANQEEKKPALSTVRGMVHSDGDKRSFVDDKDGKSWSVDNPEFLKNHDGHHVELACQINTDNQQIHVVKVTMLPH